MLNCFGEIGRTSADIIETVHLSRCSVTRRVEELYHYLDTLLTDKLKFCSYFSIALDESCDISDVSQLILAIRMVDKDFNVTEEIFALIPLMENTRGVDIFNAVTDRLQLKDGEINKLSAVCTDGAPAMLGKNNGFIGQLIKNNIRVPSFHCAIHQEALCTKGTNNIHTMNVVVKIINKIRGGHNSLTHRKLKMFLEECESQYKDLLMFTEVRWLSRGTCLERFFELRKEVVEFLDLNMPNFEFLNEIKSEEFNISLGFLTDVTTHLNNLNSSLQGKNKNIFNLIGSIEGF